MQMLNARYSAVVLALLCASGAALASPFGVYDARSVAMGGTGVSSASSGSAPYFNPALLSAARRKSATALEMKATVRAADPDKLADDVDNMEKAGNDLDDAITAFNNSPAGNNPTRQAASGQMATALGNFRNVFSSVSNKTLEAGAFASPLTLSVPGKDLGWAIFGAARAEAGGRLVFENSDNALLASYQAAAQQYATSGSNLDLQTLVNTFGGGTGCTTNCTLNDPNFASHLDVRGVALQEIGISFSREFHGRSMNWSMGITPKYVKVATFDYSVKPDESEFDADTGRKDYKHFNVDIGIAKDLGSGWKAGLVGRNLVTKKLTTALGNTLELKPSYRAGLSHHTSWTAVALDVDLGENKSLTGFDKPTQFVALGIEFDAWLLQFRAGYRHDLAGNYEGIPSVGVGLSLGFLAIDAAIARRGTDEVQGAVQLAFRF